LELGDEMQLTTEWMTSAAQLIDFRELVKPRISAWASSSWSSGERCVAGRLVAETRECTRIALSTGRASHRLAGFVADRIGTGP
jgi:hypothetical protein